MSEKNSFFLEKLFSQFYKKHLIRFTPKQIEKREFGVGYYKQKIARRHLSFQTEAEFNNYLREKTPLFISSSDSIYKYPKATPMSAKEWLGSDITYEFDADDISNSFYWYCTCGANGRGKPEVCPECSKKPKIVEFFSQKDLEETKKEMFRLIKVVESEFNFPVSQINFSGNAGYHLHIRDKEISSLSKEARIELIDYLRIENYNLERMGFINLDIPKNRKGIAKKLISYLSNMPSSDLKLLLSTKKEVLPLKKSFADLGKKSKEKWHKALDYAAHKLKIEIDRQTSADIYKIIRVPNTLHGGTGLIARSIPIDKFKEFNPFSDALVFSEKQVEIEIDYCPKIFLKNSYWGPFQNEKIKVPEYLAVFLIGKGVARIV